MNIKHPRQYQQGIGVIEVMVAAVIFALGIAALIQLQGAFFTNSSSAQARAVAAIIAEEQLEELRQFDDDSIGATFVDITSGANSLTVGNTDFTVQWGVDGYAYNAGVLTPVAPTAASVAQKSVEINVTWVDTETQWATTDEANRTFTLQAIINSNSGLNGGLLADQTGGSGESPTVPHIELAAPDVLRVKVKTPPPENFEGTTSEWNALSSDDKAKEYAKLGRCNIETYGATEAPDPEVNTNPTLDNVIVKFTSSKYQKYNPCTYDYNSDDIDTIDTSTSQVVKLIDEEFVTVNCECQLAASASGYDESGASVTKALTGTKTGASNQQDEFCNLCCRDHHENISGDFQCGSGANPEFCIDPWRTAGSDYTASDHKHFLSSDLNTVAGIGDDYSEVCRIKRVDGFYRVIPDWRMIAHNVLVESDFGASSAIASYESYLGTQINESLQGNAVTAWSYASAAVPLNDEQMMSRSIYLDYLTAAEIADAEPATSGNEVDIAVDFYEYKTTQLSDWSTETVSSTDTQAVTPCDPSSSSIDACTDSPSIADYANNNSDKGIFRYDATVTGDVDIVSVMGVSNSGVVSALPIDTADDSSLNASYAVAFGAGPPAPVREVKMATTANLVCPSTKVVGNGNNAVSYARTSVSTVNWNLISLTCSPDPDGNNNGSCVGYASDQNNVTVNANLNGAVLSCSYADGVTHVCPDINALSGGDRLDVDGSFSCTVGGGIDGAALDCDLVCN